jgi:hypothetical protein
MDGAEAAAGRQQLIGGQHSRSLADVRARLNIDTTELGKLKKGLDEIKASAKGIREEFDLLAKSASKAADAIAATKGGGSKGYNKTTIDVTDPSAVKLAPGSVPAPTSATGGAGGAGARGGIKGMGFAGAAAVAGQVGGAAMQAMDSRIARGTAYATSADRLNVLMQQMSGMSQMQVMQTRMPSTNYRLGAGAQNAMMQFGAETGFDVMGMGAGLEAMRTSTGFSKTTGDLLQQQRQLMGPEVANRMLYTLGVNAYQMGGGMQDPFKVQQQVVQRMGLANEDILKGAMAPGSVTRMRMSQAGLGEEMQNQYLQYAKQQVAFEKAGGQGMYDPSNKSHRQRMGIEDNLATQQEETSRVQVQREENFMQRQIDNMATREKIDQKLIEVLGKLEDTLSGVIGARTSGQSLMRFGGSALKVIGGITMGAAGFTGVGAAVGAGMIAAGSAIGDGDDQHTAGGQPTPPAAGGSAPPSSGASDSQIMVPGGERGSARIPLSQLKQQPRFAKLDSRLKEKLLRMMRDNPNVGLSSGFRDEAQQEELFYRQMEETDEANSQTQWNGKYWKAKAGYAFTAPPNHSMHGLGLAADIFEEGDGRSYAWIVANSEKYGLNNWRAKGWRDEEPWHVQPVEVPRFRSQYGGGGDGGGTYTEDGTYFDVDGDRGRARFINGEYVGSADSPIGPNFMNTMGMSENEIIAGQAAQGLEALQSGGSTGGGGRGRRPAVSAFRNMAAGGGASTSTRSGPGSLSAEEVARIARSAGFRGDALVTAVAIAGRESSYRPAAHRTDNDPAAMTGDFGLWQINYSNLTPEFMAAIGASSREDLFDPAVNAAAAYRLSSQGTSWTSWGYTPGKGWDAEGDHLAGTNIEMATQAVTNISGSEQGDPMITHSPTKGGRSSVTTINSSPNIVVSPEINFYGSSSNQDHKQIAQAVTRLLQEELNNLNFRTS